MLGLIKAGAGLAGGIFGGIKAGKERRKQRRMLEEQERKNQEWYNRNYYSNYLDSTEARAALKRVENTLHRQQQETAATAAVMGSTPEAIQAQQQANNELLGDVATGLAANATARKNEVDDKNLANQQEILSAKMGQSMASEAGAGQMMNSSLGILGTALQGSDLLNKWLAPKPVGAKPIPRATPTLASMTDTESWKKMPENPLKGGL